MFSFFKKKNTSDATASASENGTHNAKHNATHNPEAATRDKPQATDSKDNPDRQGWLARLGQGLKRTGQSISGVFVGARIDDALYEELEAALLMADAGGQATQHVLDDLKRRVRRLLALRHPCPQTHRHSASPPRTVPTS